ncbi:hypothetical protein [Roseobacter weihaiensis]|uniref:hypothetical protein n=1 Tax=Roseobacter weihaiensis TaxID=2763262 RepID=UPI001D0AD77E|nr:hypothetical protein [Roseobacter sp. H9]
MSIGPVNEWDNSLADVTSVAPIAGAEALWAGIIFVFGIWFVIAIYRIGAGQEADVAQEFSDPDLLRRLLAYFEGQSEQESNNDT